MLNQKIVSVSYLILLEIRDKDMKKSQKYILLVNCQMNRILFYPHTGAIRQIIQ